MLSHGYFITVSCDCPMCKGHRTNKVERYEGDCLVDCVNAACRAGWIASEYNDICCAPDHIDYLKDRTDAEDAE